VRGYPESIVNGDSGYTGSVEYRLHLPRLLPINPSQEATLLGRPFRTRPTQVYNFPDWDFVIKGFIDVGQVFSHDLNAGIETDDTLIGAGVGAELWVRRNARFRLDAATALSELDSGLADEGNQEIHLEFSLFF
jgi:hemolysin activation/secretion protein